jgi:bifunctional DNase/RNase
VSSDFKDLFGDWEPREPRRPDEGEPENREPRSLNEKEVKVRGVFEHADTTTGAGQTFVLLEDNMGRKVPIFIGRFEAFAISMAMEQEEVDRPMTYDLLKVMVERLDATVERVIIDDLWQDIFYAKVGIARNGDIMDIDCRPSDAVNIALRFRAPIYMAESVIEAIDQKY